MEVENLFERLPMSAMVNIMLCLTNKDLFNTLQLVNRQFKYLLSRNDTLRAIMYNRLTLFGRSNPQNINLLNKNQPLKQLLLTMSDEVIELPFWAYKVYNENQQQQIPFFQCQSINATLPLKENLFKFKNILGNYNRYDIIRYKKIATTLMDHLTTAGWTYNDMDIDYESYSDLNIRTLSREAYYYRMSLEEEGNENDGFDQAISQFNQYQNSIWTGCPPDPRKEPNLMRDKYAILEEIRIDRPIHSTAQIKTIMIFGSLNGFQDLDKREAELLYSLTSLSSVLSTFKGKSVVKEDALIQQVVFTPTEETYFPICWISFPNGLLLDYIVYLEEDQICYLTDAMVVLIEFDDQPHTNDNYQYVQNGGGFSVFSLRGHVIQKDGSKMYDVAL